ncbi:GGDEF domain-containing protein [Mesorhizobium sp. CA18]|uniref:GGDEF domain-containing protein n=1 Tax=unclassified Mesorhizobium TaxID=325217 RepID=UPI001CCE51AD|nr:MULTISPECIES: GGDEF domain-containing protein [unclassified Mesorhizobium]MBZ9735004.1 GGDEF domain-containing protein [Mesorhizobium sp. CA9]MBZ9828780.1 GGDEF domain-containing protein [Mesorhizobium sp. CA18]MBZ9834280.1 GGDEF domain-containing protein [Mesorhizobium sp. CA2]MBZ9838869.1 GGDEF domain-containing protein [Mesorhizobium sp. CA3]MBZ9880082.1 GGDEF domain-containing protein [Mesorhizobium sp. Ca11]
MSDLTHIDVQDDPALIAEVDRLLARRTRDIRLKGEVRRLFRARVWPQTAKIIRAWMIWVAVLDMLTLALNMLMLPTAIAQSMLLPGAIIPPVVIAVVLAWRKPRPPWFEGASLITGMFLILLSVALVGVSAGGEFYERQLNVMLFVAITAIIIFGIPLAWTVAIAALALGLYLVFQVQNPAIEHGSAVAGTLFFASGIFATVAARRIITILAQKTFLFELRDRRRVAELAKANDRLELLAKTDPLTGIANRHWMTETLDHLWGNDKRCLDGAAMLMCDIDHFKKLNDHLGHAEGDRCLVEVANIIQENVRRDRDHVARYGGEEFLVLLPGVTEEEAVSVAERVRKSVEAAALPNPGSRVSRSVTLSIGVAVQTADEAISPEQLQGKADAALYLAKQTGRNRVLLHTPDPAGRKHIRSTR